MKPMLKKYIFLPAFLLAILTYGQEKPKLVVGIVVDQMRQEYLYRFEKKFGEGGFKRVLNEGFMLTNAHYNYVPTYTGPGHASVYTGSTPAIHGIIGNDWWDKIGKARVNCVSDNSQTPVGGLEGSGKISPWRLLSTTVTDELKLATQGRAKVIGISIKDRGAVLPAGHLADGAFWFESKSGNFISSSYYNYANNALPNWVQTFNAAKWPQKFIAQPWDKYLKSDPYIESGADASPYENQFANQKNTLPYDLKLAGKDGFEVIAASPYGDDLLTEFAKAAIKSESLGKDDDTDFLAVSFSSPDLIGHAMGPMSVEVEDTYIRLDKNVEDILKTLDAEVGKNNYTVFLTADHAVAEVPQFLKDKKVPAGNFTDDNALKDELNTFLQKYFPNKNLVESVGNCQIFFNSELFAGDPRSSGIDLLIATELVSNYLQQKEGVAQVYSKSIIKQGSYSEEGTKGMLVRGYNHKRSGDISFVLEPGWINGGGKTGTTHGSSYTYDTHVPILFFGNGIKKGTSSTYHPITDIAPTISTILRIKFPSGSTGQPIKEVVE
jgi:predicted AlkP superfamily pyrophosphatase or phosphodiesterase